jgi:hypothetical protein
MVCCEAEEKKKEFLQKETKITWFGGGSFSFRGLSFSENHLWISFRCS